MSSTEERRAWDLYFAAALRLRGNSDEDRLRDVEEASFTANAGLAARRRMLGAQGSPFDGSCSGGSGHRLKRTGDIVQCVRCGAEAIYSPDPKPDPLPPHEPVVGGPTARPTWFDRWF